MAHGKVAAIVLFALMCPPLFSQSLAMKDIRRFYIEDYKNMIGDNRGVADCLKVKMPERGSFIFEESRGAAEAVLTIDTTISSGKARVLLGKAPSVKVTITSIDGRKLWNGENRYKKGTTAWGSATDIHCGLANGIADKIVKAMQGKK